MEQITFRVHVRLVAVSTKLVPGPVRVCMEKSLLLGALVQLAILVGLHYLYISSQLKDSNLITRALQRLQPASVTFLDGQRMGSNCLLESIRGHKVLQTTARSYASTSELLQDYPVVRIQINDGSSEDEAIDPSPKCYIGTKDLSKRGGRSLAGDVGLTPSCSSGGSSSKLYLFVLETGHLFLQPSDLASQGLGVLDINIANNASCFGLPAASWVLRAFVGYDSVLVHWGLGDFGQRGFLYNVSVCCLHLKNPKKPFSRASLS